MTHQPDDADLRSRFAALRREDAEHAAPFSVPRRRRAPARAPLRWVTGAGLAAAVLAMIWVAGVRDAGRRGEFAAYMTTTAWRGPTDFLLQTPGREFLSAVPAVGVPDVGITPKPSRRTGMDTARQHRRVGT